MSLFLEINFGWKLSGIVSIQTLLVNEGVSNAHVFGVVFIQIYPL